MAQLFEVLASKVATWRKSGYSAGDFNTISEILEWAKNPDGSGFTLRPPQIRALETYWYLRLVEETPHIFELYKRCFSQKAKLLEALGIADEAFKEVNYDDDILWRQVKSNDDFAQRHRLQVLRETINLEYSSYILALAMGAGKTALIGAIIATEFAMALEYPQGPFVQNALVFAPGKTIIESLRELAEVPYERILPPRLFKQFAATVKLTFTRDGDPDIPIIERSFFNVVVTNTEKIRIQKESIRKSDIGSLFASEEKEEEAKEEVANRRLTKIASLPHLAVFSDEAHHTYGQALDTELKKVRKTVDYLHLNSPNLICVVNTTGTPYFQRQPLRDVVAWYGLSEGIRDGILKDISENIRAYDFSDDNVEGYVSEVIEDFFKDYGAVALPDGTPSKLAIYLPQTDDAERLRPVIEAKLAQLGLPTTLILEHHTKNEHKSEFDRFRLKDSQQRIALLVDRGVEGWNVPALFATCLARRLKTSNNFVLQAACRCLRQVPGNPHKARIYLSMDNRSILDRQLQETYGETLDDLGKTERKSEHAIIRLRKLKIPKMYVRQLVRMVVRRREAELLLHLSKPSAEYSEIEQRTFTVSEQQSTHSVLVQVGDAIKVSSVPAARDVYTVSTDFAAMYRLDFWQIYDELKRLYGTTDIPDLHFPEIGRQIEEQLGVYEIKEETIERGLALVKLEGFEKNIEADGTESYTAEITYPIDRANLLKSWNDWKEKAGTFGFHYDPYNFDSKPEAHFFEEVLGLVKLAPDDVDDIYFTGALTDPKKTEFYVEYKGEDGNWHRYTPDFLIRRKDGKTLIVEIKQARFESSTNEDLERASEGKVAVSVEGRKAVELKKWQDLNPEILKYQIIYTSGDVVSREQVEKASEFLKEK
ncbi:MAG: DEAD/DEAH box helicase family protein [Ignavibacteriales bacterium]|nr:DEAD/DEAH box helicase family protein [Ignavibacteriales bacterium]